MCPNQRRNLQISKKSVPLHRVFHSIRFKVNKRLEQGVAPFFLPIIENKKKSNSCCSFLYLFFCISFDGLSSVRTYRYNLNRCFQLFFQEANISIEFFREFIF